MILHLKPSLSPSSETTNCRMSWELFCVQFSFWWLSGTFWNNQSCTTKNNLVSGTIENEMYEYFFPWENWKKIQTSVQIDKVYCYFSLVCSFKHIFVLKDFFIVFTFTKIIFSCVWIFVFPLCIWFLDWVESNALVFLILILLSINIRLCILRKLSRQS